MRSQACIVAIALLAGAGTAPATPRMEPEARLAEEVDGRLAGAAVKCVDVGFTRDVRIVDDVAILYDQGRTIYVNRPLVGRGILDDSHVIVSKPLFSRLCKGDILQMRDSVSGMPVGSVRLEEFVPYRRPPKRR